MTTEISLGPGRSAFPTVFPEAAGSELAGRLAGYRVTHPGCSYEPNGETGSWIPVGEDGWTQMSAEPLHLEPSLLCRLCGDHGFIRDGKWVPA